MAVGIGVPLPVTVLAAAVIVLAVVVMMMAVAMIVVVLVLVMMMRVDLDTGADALDVMVVARLREPDLVLEAEELDAILAELAVHVAGALEDLLDARGEAVEHQRMVVEVGRLDELDLGMARRHEVGVLIDALHENAGEKEIGKDDDAPVAEPRGVLERRLDQREGDAASRPSRPSRSRSLPTACA